MSMLEFEADDTTRAAIAQAAQRVKELEEVKIRLRQVTAIASLRDELIVQARDLGAEWSELGELSGLTRQGAMGVYRRFKERHQ